MKRENIKLARESFVPKIQNFGEGPMEGIWVELTTAEFRELCDLALRATDPGMVMLEVSQLETWRYGLGKALETLPQISERNWVWPVWYEIGELYLPYSAPPRKEQP